MKLWGSGSLIVSGWELLGKFLLPGENLRELLTAPPALAGALPSWLQHQKLWREL